MLAGEKVPIDNDLAQKKFIMVVVSQVKKAAGGFIGSYRLTA